MMVSCTDGSLPPSRDEQASQNPEALNITMARWNTSGGKLEANGQGAPDEQITVTDGDTGAVLGIAEFYDGNNWRFEAVDLDRIPCSIVAVAGILQSQMAVEDAPGDCRSQPGGPDLQTSHAGRFTLYEGSKTCNECHNESREVHASVHYQWHGSTPHVVNMEGGGKLGGINDFCGYPDINFIGQLTNFNGETIDGGCALCHVGMGDKPISEPTQAQLDNIDCLICHSDSYRRKVVRLSDGSFAFAPAPEKMDVSLLQAITDIRREPTKGACVNCHSYAGGGCNNKRGDLEEAHRDPPNASFDVHMASRDNGGAGLICQDCHVTEGHRFAGRGVDLRPTDLNMEVRCTNCHPIKPHNQDKLNDHTGRLDCATCHIPVFAKITSTDMVRDYSRLPQISQDRQLYEPHIERRDNVVPEYRFWNGSSTIYEFGAAFERSESGRVLMAGPRGDITDSSAKIYPFKHHLAVQPYDVDTNKLLPLKLDILFQTGDVDGAIEAGAEAVGWPLNNGYDFVETERFMGLFHEVSPAADALSCDRCHGENGRMDFDALGYTPLPERNPETAGNCASGCHSDLSRSWPPWDWFPRDDDDDDGGNPPPPPDSFVSLHNRHVDLEGIECSICHSYY
jgi:hypothetical protein